SPHETVAFNALVVAGELATAKAATLVIKKLPDARDPVRLGAAAAAGRTFNAVKNGQPAIASNDLETLTERLGERLLNETQPQVLDTVLRSLLAAMEVTQPPIRPRPRTG